MQMYSKKLCNKVVSSCQSIPARFFKLTLRDMTLQLEVLDRADRAVKSGKPFSVELQLKDQTGMLVRFTAMFRSPPSQT